MHVAVIALAGAASELPEIGLPRRFPWLADDGAVAVH